MPYCNYFIEIPKGEAMIGLETRSARMISDISNEVFEALPATSVIVPRFLMQVHPVTCAEYYDFLKQHPLIEVPAGLLRAGKLPEFLADRPITGVTWDEARAYAKWIDARLPTEIEWEYAARSTDGRPYPWGVEADRRIRQLSRLPRVMRYPDLSSPFGVQDMLGVVDEWTATRVRGGWMVAKGCPYAMKIFHASRRFLLKPKDRWLITGFRCVKTIR